MVLIGELGEIKIRRGKGNNVIGTEKVEKKGG